MTDPYPLLRKQFEDGIAECERNLATWEEVRITPAGASRADWLKSGILTSLEQIGKQSKTINDMLRVIESNPARFNIAPAELAARKEFRDGALKRIENIRVRLNSDVPTPAANSLQAERDRLMRSKVEDNSRFIDEELGNQQEILRRQDEDIDTFGLTVGEVVHVAKEINTTLKDHNERLTDISNHMDRTDSNIQKVNQKMIKMLNHKDFWNWLGCIVLTIIIVALALWAFVF